MSKHQPVSDNEPGKAEDVLALIKRLDVEERKRLFMMLDTASGPAYQSGYAVFPIKRIELMAKAEETIVTAHGEALTLAKKYAQRLKRRKSAPETIRRNVEICDHRKQDPKKWSQGKLARTYHVTPRLIREVLKEEEKWRKLAAALLRTN